MPRSDCCGGATGTNGDGRRGPCSPTSSTARKNARPQGGSSPGGSSTTPPLLFPRGLREKRAEVVRWARLVSALWLTLPLNHGRRPLPRAHREVMDRLCAAALTYSDAFDDWLAMLPRTERPAGEAGGRASRDDPVLAVPDAPPTKGG